MAWSGHRPLAWLLVVIGRSDRTQCAIGQRSVDEAKRVRAKLQTTEMEREGKSQTLFFITHVCDRPLLPTSLFILT